MTYERTKPSQLAGSTENRMARAGFAVLAPAAVQRRVSALGLKQYWLAEQLKVNRRTVLRWVNGQVTRIQYAQLEALATLLCCRPDDLCAATEEATSDATLYMETAQRIAAEDLLAALTPMSSYPLLESLVRSALHPGLPKALSAKLQNLLAVAAARQFRFEVAERHAQRALALGEALADEGVVATARQHLGLVRLYAGRIVESEALYRVALASFECRGDLRGIGHATFGLGSCRGFLEDLEGGIQLLQRAAQVQRRVGEPCSLSMSTYVLGEFCLDAGEGSLAAEAFEESSTAASSRGYSSGVEKARAALASLKAKHGAVAEASGDIDACFAALAGAAFVHPRVFVHAAAVALAAGDPRRALRYVEDGAPHAARFVPDRATLRAMEARIYIVLGEHVAARGALDAASADRKMMRGGALPFAWTKTSSSISGL